MQPYESLEAWLDGVHAGYAARFAAAFREAGYASVAEVRGLTPTEHRDLRSLLERAGAKAPQLRLIDGAIADLASPVATVVVDQEPPDEGLPVATVVPTRPPAAQAVETPTGVAVALAPHDALQIPVATVVPGRDAGLERVFLGMGWRELDKQATGVIDVDCSVTGFAAGRRLEEHTVSYVRLHNGGGQAGAAPATIVHTGDVLWGQETTTSAAKTMTTSSSAGLVDLERIYVDLAQLPTRIDALALEANVYTPDRAFDALAAAYVRLVNADTNQELARFELQDLGTTRVAVFSRMFRVRSAVSGQPEWRFVAAHETTDALFRHKAPTQPSMRWGGDAVGPPSTTSTGVVVVAAQPVAAAVVPTDASKRKGGLDEAKRAPDDDSDDAPSDRRHQQRSRGATYASPPVAIATAAGVAAAVAIFANAGALSRANFEPGLFESGVDFGAAVDLGGAWGGTTVADSLQCCDPCDACCAPLADCADSVGGLCADGADACAACPGATCDAVGQACDAGCQCLSDVCGALAGAVGGVAASLLS